MLKLAIFICSLIITVSSYHPQFKVIFEWNYIQYKWPSSMALKEAIKEGSYVSENNVISGIKLWKDKLYLTIPRWKNGVPVTLAVTSSKPVNTSLSEGSNIVITDPELEPYPNWEMQKLNDCNALQLVQSMEIDPKGRMWILDTGRTNTMSGRPTANCPPRLVILDLENNGLVLHTYVFPDQVAHKESAFLNDIVLDHEDGGFAFITDNGRIDPGIIVYSLRNNTSWKIRHGSMKAQEDAINFKVSKTPITRPVNIDGIALSPAGKQGDRIVYYSPLSSFHLYSIPVSILKNPSLENVSVNVTDLGKKPSQSDGMVMTNQGVLYLGLLADDAIGMWNLTKSLQLEIGFRSISRDHDLMQWPDAFAIDESGHLWCVTNGLQKFITNTIDISKPNYRVIRSSTSAKNYQYFENGTAPELPAIGGASERINLALSSCLTIMLVFLFR